VRLQDGAARPAQLRPVLLKALQEGLLSSIGWDGAAQSARVGAASGSFRRRTGERPWQWALGKDLCRRRRYKDQAGQEGFVEHAFLTVMKRALGAVPITCSTATILPACFG
jgi:hypothetical protein